MTASHYIATGEKHLGVWLGELWNPPRFVYVIQGDPGTPIKVGLASDVHKRMASLQTGYPWTLRLLYVIPGDQHLEWYLHQRLKGQRLRGEWFKPDVAFLDYVAELADRMMDAWDGSMAVPYYGDFSEIQDALPASKRQHVVTVSHVEPDPVMTHDQAAELHRLSIRYGARSLEAQDFKRRVAEAKTKARSL